ncbi:MAG: cell division protein FtsK [Chloroflexi bacterium HGW-Chloroflexi-7]|nr:MAG: cell division protein FtsK [Chloroflexi bacterium HGW-Chloroflexi-7]
MKEPLYNPDQNKHPKTGDPIKPQSPLQNVAGFFGVSKGAIITPWIRMLNKFLGWGAIIAILMVGLTGVSAFRYSAGKSFPLSLGRVIALEGAFFSMLAVLSIIGGFSLERAEVGKDGGVLGWGLARLFPGFLGAILYTGFFVVLSLVAAGVLSKVIQKIISWSNQSHVEREPYFEREIRQQVTPQTKSMEEDLNALVNMPQRDDRLPPLNLLMSEHNVPPDQAQIKLKAQTIENTLAEFGLPVKVIGFRVGPTITQYALEPGFIVKTASDGTSVKQKVRVSQISGLSRDLTLALKASRLRIETPVPGRNFVGVEVPNNENNVVRMRPILDSTEFRTMNSPLALALGRNVSGEVVVADLEKMPHLLIAGTTNSGKSVCITAITTCLVMNNSPYDLKLVMLDPKMVELVRFNGLPHLLGKVETETERMQAVLRWALAEMDARYRLLADARARNIESYNHKMVQKNKPKMPRIVILIDELADLMMSAPDQTEHSLIRLAQMARATGMHLVVATQRPSTDVVTGLIKANFPARISFAVASSIDSRVILDNTGAESLLGKGDMLYLDPAKAGLQRVQGILMGDSEIEKVINHWQRMNEANIGEEAPWEGIVDEIVEAEGDQLVEQAIGVVKAAGKASVSLLQRRLRIGYPRAARLIDELEEMGVVGPSMGSGRDREVLVDGNNGEESDYIED